MAVNKLLNLFALSSLAILACSYGAQPVQAGSVDAHHFGRRASHEGLARKKRDDSSASKRCKARSTPTSSWDAPSSTDWASSSWAPAPTSSSWSDPAPSSSWSSSAAPAAPTGKKFGLAWANGDSENLQYWLAGQTTPIYTWSPEIPQGAKDLGFDPVPMLWGWNQVDQFSQLVVEGYANKVLGPNEPNETGQSNLSSDDGVKMWQQYIEPLADKGYQLISPAVSSRPNGFTWMQEFFQKCTGCRVSAVALHWYDVDAEAFKAYIEKFHNEFQLPIWVTEFADQNFNGGPQVSQDDVYSFMGEVTSWMDQQDYVQYYFPFGVMQDMQGVSATNQLMGADGKPNSLGWNYIGA